MILSSALVHALAWAAVAAYVLSAFGGAKQGGLGLPAPTGGALTLSRATSLSFYVATLRDGPCVPATA